MKLNFVTVDVFTDRPFGGNPLAVVLNAEGLPTERMQAIAAEFNLAETTFVMPPRNPAHTAHVRIFTPRAEMPFAGHPNVGTAFALARAGQSYGRAVVGDRLVFEEKAGLVRLELAIEAGQVVGARLAAPQLLKIGVDADADLVAAACSLPVEEIETRNHRPLVASCGAAFIFAELKSRAALAAAQPRADVFIERLPRDGVTGIHLYVQEQGEGAEIQTRMFAPLHGIPEDPATGAANVALIGLLAHLRPETDLALSLTIGQGFDMGRPSLLEASAEKKAGHVTATYIGGRCVAMMSGTIEL